MSEGERQILYALGAALLIAGWAVFVYVHNRKDKTDV